MKAILVQEDDPLQSMQLGEWPSPIASKAEILVKVHATALNRADLLQRRGKYPPPKGASPILGLEFSGEVLALGKGVNKWKIGDRVCGLLAGGAYAEQIVIHEDLALPIPGNLSLLEAAAIPEVFLTAFQALNWLAELQKGEKVLIHAGASGVGTAAIQLAKLFGAQVFVSASKAKHQICKDLGADFCIDYKSEEFDELILAQTEGQGVQVLIDFIGATYFMANLKSLSMDGRMVLLGFLSGFSPEKVNLAPILLKRLKIMGSTLRARPLAYKIQLSQALKKHTWDAFEKGQLVPVIDSVYPILDVNAAHQRMEQNLNQGKILLKF